MKSMIIWRLGLLLTLGCVSASVLAQGTTDPINACSRIVDAAARLACFDRLAQRHDGTIGLDGKQLSIERRKEGIHPAVVPRIVTAIAKLESRPGHQYEFRLENGQVWESTDTEPDLFLKPHDAVTIRPGVFGAFFLRTEEGNSIRVHRVR